MRVARALDESPRVRVWVKNHLSGSRSPIPNQGVGRRFTPDFLVQSHDGENLLVEVKGLEREPDRSKDVGAARWIAAVNHWARLGRWRYAKILGPYDLQRVLAVAA